MSSGIIQPVAKTQLAVSFDAEAIKLVRELAEINDRSVGQIIRILVDLGIDTLKNDGDTRGASVITNRPKQWGMPNSGNTTGSWESEKGSDSLRLHPERVI